jgi:hypothetical protein
MLRSTLFIYALAIASVARGEDLDALKAEIQGKQPEEIRALIIRRFGPPARNIGSGVRTSEWDVEGGVLSFSLSAGPAFDRGPIHIWLLRTNNPAALSLFGHYGMTTELDGPDGLCCDLGDLSLSWDLRYQYTESQASLDHRNSQADKFFVLHPSGRLQINYASGVTAASRLEDLPDGSLVATLRFLARDRRSSKEFQIFTDHTWRVLESGRADQSLRLRKSWANLWR